MTLFDLTGRIAVVTGGNGGIGLGMAKGLATAGAEVAPQQRGMLFVRQGSSFWGYGIRVATGPRYTIGCWSGS